MSGITRRRALGTVAAAAGTAAAAPVLAAAAPALAAGPAPTRSGSAGHDPASFDEVYRGRRIQGHPSGGGHHGGHGSHAGHSGYTVLIDGEELHVMQNADGTWISVITHYDPVPSPHAAARAAVVELQGSPLVPLVTA